MDLGKLTQQLADSSSERKLPPVDQWDPPFCGDMDLTIKRDGDWWHNGTPFTRAKLVSLFASVLKKENDQYFLVTPVEKIGIRVEDVPFIIVDWRIDKGALKVKTQVGDEFVIGEEHPVELRQFSDESTLVPYCLVRRNLWGRLHQNVLYQWVEVATETQTVKGNELVMRSNDYAFSLGVF